MSYLSSISTTYKSIDEKYTAVSMKLLKKEMKKIIAKKVDMNFTLLEARRVTSPTGMKIKPMKKNVAMTCIQHD